MPIASERGTRGSPEPSAETPVPEYPGWRKGVAGVLAKVRKGDAADFGDEPEKLLDQSTYDGLTITPLYTRRDELPEQPLPGTFPFVRGNESTRDVHRGWHVSAKITATTGVAANSEILTGLENGVSAVWLVLGQHGVPVEEIPAALTGLLFELAPLTLDAGPHIDAAADRIFAVLDDYSAPERRDIQVALGAAPLTSTFGDVADIGFAEAIAIAGRCAARSESVRALTVDGRVFHDAGAADAQELGAAVAAGLEYLRALTPDLSVSGALGQLEFRFAATDDQFATLAKFRAARQLWARVAQVCGEPEAGNAPQHAVTSAAMMSQRDPWVNLLRSTLASFGAGVGGADTVTVLPFDSALPPGELGVSTTFSERMARNTQLLLLEESHLGHVRDPGAGSWYIEDFTSRLAAKAWEFMQEIEAEGGYLAALGSGMISRRIAETKTAREADVAHRRTPVTGLNEFPNLAEEPLSQAAREPGKVARYGAAFEALRNRSDAYLAEYGLRPQALLVPLGTVAEHNVRVTFIANLLGSGGIEAVDPGPLDAASIAAAVSESEASIAVLCGSDARYGSEAGSAVEQLRAAGVKTVLLAGSEKAVADLAAEQRPDGYLAARIDAVAALTALLEKVGA